MPGNVATAAAGTVAEGAAAANCTGVLLLGVEPGEAVASQGRLRDGTTEGQHGQAPVLQLLQLHLLDLRFFLGKEVHTQTVVTCVFQGEAGLVGNIAGLRKGGEHLHQAAEGEDLEQRTQLVSLLVVEIRSIQHEGEIGISSARIVRLYHCLGAVALLRPWNPSKLGHHQAHKGQHGNSSVLQFCLSEPWQVLFALHRQTQRVEVEVLPSEGRFTANEAASKGLLLSPHHRAPARQRHSASG
mmetsp:Transcript_102912/g.125774  ORF Transcript_102912/g.125774 Transcript_102912/m.125774 type:complete len:242 (-) Transcript_102912:66-791(-)